MCKKFPAIGFGAWLVLSAGMETAAAKQCSPEMPSNPPRHWSYRLIDGRKCWYEGENNFPKALLQWPEQTKALSAFNKADPPKDDVRPAIPETGGTSESFEARWRAIEAAQ
jgi:hypothetical protein